MNWMGPATVGLVTTVALMLALRPLAAAGRLIDVPGGRKSHVGDVPVIGGIAMFFGIAAGLSLLPGGGQQYLFMLLAGGILLGIGVLDDRQQVSLYVRLGAQAIAASVMVYGGQLLIADLGDLLGTGVIHLGAGTYVFTVLVSISVINAFNFIDGVDGLAGCLAAIAIGSVAIVSSVVPTPITTVGIVACASIIGFLVFNFPALFNRRLRSFMGDGGSTLLGIVVLWLTISASQGEARPMSPIIGLWFVLIPLADLFTCFIRRIAKGQSPFTPGRGHLHHILLRGKLTDRQVLLTLTGLGATYAGAALVANRIGVPDVVMFGGWTLLMFVQYPLIKKIALTARSQCWKRLRANPAKARDPLLPQA
ncbi:MAG: hypothetical protein O3A13_16605 [Proteobacteria bacterium]|nr:hypothetical protein [Pseudomonadota bacterium]